MKGGYFNDKTDKFYKFANHFFPGLVYNQAKKPPATIMPAVKIAPNISIILAYFNILFPIVANITVSKTPATNTYQLISVSI